MSKRPTYTARLRVAIAVAGGLLAGVVQADAPAVLDAWVAETPPGARVAAGYLELQNLTDETLRLTGAMSERFERVEIHRTLMQEGVVRMRAVDLLEIEPGETLAFEPGALHLMIRLGDEGPVRAGERIPLTIVSNLGPIEFTAPVLRADQAPSVESNP